MLDFPTPRHLLDHQLGVHRHRDLGGAQVHRILQTAYQTPVFGNVVGGAADRLLGLRKHVVRSTVHTTAP